MKSVAFLAAKMVRSYLLDKIICKLAKTSSLTERGLVETMKTCHRILSRPYLYLCCKVVVSVLNCSHYRPSKVLTSSNVEIFVCRNFHFRSNVEIFVILCYIKRNKTEN